jgi:hypothetical protein
MTRLELLSLCGLKPAELRTLEARLDLRPAKSCAVQKLYRYDEVRRLLRAVPHHRN